MKYPIFAMRDRHVGFLSPTVDQNENTAMRNFARAINNGDGVMNFSPGDFDLYKIGTFDSETGCLDACAIPQLIVTGLSVFGAKE